MGFFSLFSSYSKIKIPATFQTIKENPERFFLFMAIVFIPLHFLIQIDRPIYGDSAVYANLGRYVAEGNFYPLRFRTFCEGIFADHPYLDMP
ncbi:hypothetical protein KKE26_12160 [bacterium]|nr:hypothetical protein [bacterium]MBU1752938.1 hypothetical protein [bacterium]